MDIQTMFDAMGEADRRTRANFGLPLQKLIERLGTYDSSFLVYVEDTDSPSNWGSVDPQSAHSYRGYYSDLAFEPSKADACTVGQLLEALFGALDDTFEGYKGGEFVMGADTPVWIAHSGTTSPGLMIINVRVFVDADGRHVVMLQARRDDYS